MENYAVIPHYRLGDFHPDIDPSAFIAPDAAVIGRVKMGPQSSVWFQCVIRGDVHWIEIGARANIQDRTVIHVTTDTWPTIIEDDVTVGHSVTLHGCTLRRGCLVGIGSIVLDNAEIGEGALIGAGSLVTPGTVIPPHTLALGSPCRVKRDLTAAERQHVADHAERYVELAARYRVPGALERR
jgi:carbonic anhydrase/acetyltransferase-like protein (isoleucine patch superfamily)